MNTSKTEQAFMRCTACWLLSLKAFVKLIVMMSLINLFAMMISVPSLAAPNTIPTEVFYGYSNHGKNLEYFSPQEACESYIQYLRELNSNTVFFDEVGTDANYVYSCKYKSYSKSDPSKIISSECKSSAGGCWRHERCPGNATPSAHSCPVRDYEKLPSSCPMPVVGNPIYFGYGNKYQVETDYASIKEALLLKFTRTYNSHSTIASEYYSISTLGALGVNWVHVYSRFVKLATNGISSILYVYRPDGQLLFFTNPTGAQWIPDADIDDKVTEVKDPATGILTGYQYTAADTGEVENYDTNGKLQKITSRAGTTQYLTYSDGSTPVTTAPFPGLLVSVADNFGRTLKFTYNSDGRMATMENPQGEITTYSYGVAPNNDKLKIVTYPDDNPSDAIFPTRTYLYGGDPGEYVYTAGVNNQPTALTGILDETGTRYATFTYDTTGRAISTEHAGAVEKYSLAFNTTDPNNPVTTITDPLGSVRSTHFTRLLDVLRPTGTDQPGGSGCSAASSATTYDGNGNVASRTDFNGHKACYAYDLARNLETKRVEGLASVADCASVLADGAALPANARKTSTQWHPDWRLPAKTAEPKKLTTYVYNGQADPFTGAVASCAPAGAQVDGKPIAVLCKQAEQNSTDTTGAAGLNATPSAAVRTRSYAYNAAGQVTREDGPRNNTTDAPDITDYEYYADTTPEHTVGDLKAVKRRLTTTPLLQHTTTYNRYDGNGRPTQITEANGVATTLDCYPRGWLKTLTVAAPDASNVETSQYSYEPTGLLKSVTQPDGNVLTYGYDDAHRLRTVTDSLGNKVSYTLDNMGNRLKETYWDPSSAAQPDESVSAVGLRRKISRSYDALDRLQTITGAGQ